GNLPPQPPPSREGRSMRIPEAQGRRGFAGRGACRLGVVLVLFAGLVGLSAEGARQTTGADRVARAKQLLQKGTVYPKGCSDFVAAVLGVKWEDANALMGKNPTYVGVNNSYKGLKPGDVVGWPKKGGHGHVAIYVGEKDVRFIDVPRPGGKPRSLKG